MDKCLILLVHAMAGTKGWTVPWNQGLNFSVSWSMGHFVHFQELSLKSRENILILIKGGR